MQAKWLQSCLILYNPIDGSLSGSSVHGNFPGKNTGVCCHSLLQGIFPPRDQTGTSYVSNSSGFLTTTPPGLCSEYQLVSVRHFSLGSPLIVQGSMTQRLHSCYVTLTPS